MPKTLPPRSRPGQPARTAGRGSSRPGSAQLGGGSRPGAAAGAQRPAHLIDYLTVWVILGVFGAIIVAVVIAFAFFSDARSQYLGWAARRDMRDQSWAKALGHWKPLRDLYPQSPVINMNMGQCLLEQGKPGEALPYLDDAVQHLDETKGNMAQVSGLYALRGWALLETGKTNEGLEELRREISQNPDHPRANYLIGSFFAKRNDLVRAGAFFQRIANRPEYAKQIADFKKQVTQKFLDIPANELSDVPEAVSPDQVTSVPIAPLVREQRRP